MWSRIQIFLVVALRKESVDRNTFAMGEKKYRVVSLSARRAWIEIWPCGLLNMLTRSLSARRAWIEIPAGCWRDARRAVALRKESVDRNANDAHIVTVCDWSLSARRAWIEIPAGCWRDARRASLSARRAWIEIQIAHQ